MRIVFLGWGSLYWDLRNLQVIGDWHFDGPSLPLEFARMSDGGRLTIVIDPNGEDTRTLWIEASTTDLNFARENLRAREETPKINNIGFISTQGEYHTRLLPGRYVESVRAWATDKGIDAVVWTALKPKWPKTEKFNPDMVIDYLKNIKDENLLREVEKYIRFAPEQVRTPIRRRIEKELRWTPLPREDIDKFKPRGIETLKTK